jgi:hypothetical protein
MQRAVRCCPQSGELWARLLRNYEILKQDMQIIGETYMHALSLGVLTRKGASIVEKPKEKTKGKDKKKAKGKGKAEVVEEESLTERSHLGDPKGADVAELAALEAAWAGFMRRMEEANADQGMSRLIPVPGGMQVDGFPLGLPVFAIDEDEDDAVDAVESTLRDGIARCRERESIIRLKF